MNWFRNLKLKKVSFMIKNIKFNKEIVNSSLN